jgi:4-amino-4-deoxy-L-arabinose transferase-like glycosyltransferase/DNA-binding beta-propeller fold protein YncE
MEQEASLNRRWLAILFLFAVSVRLFRVDWDQHHFFHPDERAIGFAVERLSFSPLQLNPHFFAYGSLTLYVIKIVTSFLGIFRQSWRGYDASIFAGREISALLGAATAVLLAALGARLYGKRIGLLAGFLMAAAVLHVQNSHFATSDVPLTFLVLLALYFLVRVVESGALRHFIGVGLAAGLAVATKFSALPIFLAVAIAVVYRWNLEGRKAGAVRRTGALALSVAAGFVLGQPYAILDFSAFRNDIVEQSRMVRHAGIFPYTNQYIGAPKYLYDLGQMVLWGMGPLLGAAAVIGTILCCVRTVRRRRIAEVVLLAWVLPFFAITGSFDVKFPRYLLPMYGLVILWGAVALVSWANRSRIGTAAVVVVCVATFAWLAAFLRIYTRPHTVVTASEWFYQNVPEGTKVASQHWDEGFPFPLPGDRNPDRYAIANLPYYEPDTPEKMAQICRDLAATEYAVFQTKRIYGSVTRAPQKFPLTTRYFYRLFAGDLGFTLVREFASRPTLFGLQIHDELADESFSVYDHPKVLVFRNMGHLPSSVIDARVLAGEPSRRLARRDLLLASPARLPAAGPAGAEVKAAPAAAPTAGVGRETATVAGMKETPAAAVTPASGAGPETQPVPAAEAREAGAGILEQPRGIAFDREGRLLVCDFGHDRIQEFDESLKPAAQWGRPGAGPGEFKQLGAVAVGPDGDVYIADTWNNRVQEFDRTGKFQREWKSGFFGPRGIAVGPERRIFVADTGNHRILRFSARGAKEKEFGGRGPEPGKLFDPIGLAASSDGRVFVCDNGNRRMQVFDRDGRSLLTFPVPGWRREVFSEPQVALGKDGTPWVTVPLEKEVRHYAADGKLLRTIRSREAPWASFDRPIGIAVAPSGDAIFVSDLTGGLVRLPVPSR